MKASLYSGQRASELLPVLAYSDDEQLFFMEDQSVGFGFLCDPLPGGDESVADRLMFYSTTTGQKTLCCNLACTHPLIFKPTFSA